MRKWLLVLAWLLSGCLGDPGTGPVEVKWDRDACDRCRMAVSDRLHSAQVRGGPVGEKTRVYRFDDLGCAVLWLAQQPWKDNPAVEIWVTDHRDGRWIDARRAYYVTGQHTPMEYGLGAQDAPADNALGFEQAVRHIFAVEERYNLHAAHASGEHGS